MPAAPDTVNRQDTNGAPRQPLSSRPNSAAVGAKGAALRLARALFAAGSLAVAAGAANAAELKVLGAGAIEEPFTSLLAGFTRETGHKVDASFGTVGGMLAKIKGGEKPDVIVLSGPGMEELEREGALAAGTRTELGRAVAGVGVKAGAAKPDISTVNAFKQALVKARAVAYTDPASGGTTGIFFNALIGRLGIADEIKRKAVLQPGGSGVARALAKGDAEVGVTFISELLPNNGVSVVGPLPQEIGLVVPYVAGVSSATMQGAAARALNAYMSSPSAREHYRHAGL